MFLYCFVCDLEEMCNYRGNSALNERKQWFSIPKHIAMMKLVWQISASTQTLFKTSSSLITNAGKSLCHDSQTSDRLRTVLHIRVNSFCVCTNNTHVKIHTKDLPFTNIKECRCKILIP
jgi:hypothetical protein